MSSAKDVARSSMLFISAIAASQTAGAAAGDRDPTYGQGGRTLITASQLGVRIQANRFLQQSDGKTVIAGWTENINTTSTAAVDFALVRLNQNGALDTSFDGDGIAIVSFNANDQGLGIAQQSDGKLVVVGLTNGGTCLLSPCTAVARFNTNGSLDPSFNGTGKVVVANAAAAVAMYGNDVAVQGSNIIIAGHHTSHGRYGVVRLTNSGFVDPSFSAGSVNPGFVSIPTDSDSFARQVVVQSDAKILVVGGTGPSAASHRMDIVRLTSDGQFDTTFNGTGISSTPCIGQCQYARVAQQPDQKLVVTGFDSTAGQGSPVVQQNRSILERRNSDGSIDTTFGSGGRLTNIFGALEPHPISVGEVASGLAVDAATGQITVIGGMIATGYLASGEPGDTTIRQAIARYTSTGAPDTTFGGGGLRMLPTSTGPSGDALGVAWYNVNLSSDGRPILLANARRTINNIPEEGIATARLSNGDPGDPGVLTVTGFVVPESAPFAWAVVARTAGSTGAVTASYSTVPVTATAGADFTQTTGTLTWADGEVRSKLIKIPLIRDAIAEPTDETFQILLSNLSAGADVANTGVVTIVRDDVTPANTLSVSGPTTVTESAGNITFTVTRTGTGPISVNYSTGWDSATGSLAQSPSDYAHTNGHLIWGTGDTTSRTITVPVVNDSTVESTEELNLAFYVLGGGAVHTNSLSTVTITDDDTAAPPPTPPAPPSIGNSGGGGGGGGGSTSLAWLAVLASLGVSAVRRRRPGTVPKGDCPLRSE